MIDFHKIYFMIRGIIYNLKATLFLINCITLNCSQLIVNSKFKIIFNPNLISNSFLSRNSNHPDEKSQEVIS